MLFYLNQFELHIAEPLLKKGLRLFKNSKISIRESSNQFDVNGFHINLKILNNQLQSFTCNCNKLSYCEHLAATLFFLQQNTLQLTQEIQTKTKDLNSINVDPGQNRLLQEIIFKSSLKKFDPKNKNNQSKLDKSFFDDFLNLLLINLKERDSKIPLNQNQIDALTKRLHQGTQLVKANKQDELIFDWYLALFSFFIFLNEFRFIGDDFELKKIKLKSEQTLDFIFKKKLTSLQKITWFKASLLSIHSNKKIQSHACNFLVPRYIVLTKNSQDIQKVEALLRKRIYKKPYDESLNRIEILKHQIEFKIYGVPKKINFGENELIEPEYLIAMCDFYFLQNKVNKAFALIDSCIHYFQKRHIGHFRIFTFYAIEKSKEIQLVDNEIKYLKLSFTFNLQINDQELSRFKKLVKKEEWNKEVNEIINTIKGANVPFVFEKLSKLLLITDNYLELIKLVIQEKNKFKLLHNLILKGTVQLDSKLMNAYAKQLGFALQEATTFIRQKELILSSKEVIEKLPQEKLELWFNLIINETGYESQIGKFILQAYENLKIAE